MAKQTVKKATFQDLINKKLAKESQKIVTKDIYVTSIDRTLTFKKPTDAEILDVMDNIGVDEDKVSPMVQEYKKLMYNSCEILQDTKLHEELEVIDPYDVVDKIFDLADIMEIGEQLMDLIGIKGKEDAVKN